MTRQTKLPFVARLLLCSWLLISVHGQDKLLQVTEKDLRAAAVYKVEPEYPAVARQIRLTGQVDLQVTVDATGQIDKVVVLRGNTLLAGSSEQAIKKWRFTAFRVDGQPVRASGPVTFSFAM